MDKKCAKEKPAVRDENGEGWLFHLSRGPRKKKGGLKKKVKKEFQGKQVLLNTEIVFMGMWSILYYWRYFKISQALLVLYLAGLCYRLANDRELNAGWLFDLLPLQNCFNLDVFS